MMRLLTWLCCLALGASAGAYTFEGYITGEVIDDQFGSEIATVDFNGDGYTDLVVGAPSNDEGGLSAGKVYLYLGGPSADLVADLHFIGAPSSFFGQALGSAGDFNGDGYEDLLIGAPFYDIPASSAGAAYLFYGGPSPDTVVDHIFTGQAASDFFGIAVAGIGDFNNDGFDDIAVGAYRADWASFTDAGKVYVYYGGTTPDFNADRILVGSADGERFGYALTAGDFTGDGSADIAVGAYSFDGLQLNQGRIYLYRGGSSPDTLSDYTITGDSAGYKYGWSLTSGDVNGDGHVDLIMGSDGVSTSSYAHGRVLVFHGGPSFDTTVDADFDLGRLQTDYLGFSIASGVDLAGDGGDEIVAGAPGNDDGGIDAGGAAVLTGPAALVADTVVLGSSASEEAGEAVGFWPWYTIGSKTAIVIGAPSYSSFTGRVHIFTFTGSAGAPPQLASIQDKVVGTDQLLQFSVAATDPDGTIPGVSANLLPSGASFIDNGNGSGTLTWIPGFADIGVHQVLFVASDGILADSQAVAITVIDTAGCCVLRGDANHNGESNVADLTYLVGYLFRGGALPPCPPEGDISGDDEINITDITALVSYLFRGGSVPSPCP